MRWAIGLSSIQEREPFRQDGDGIDDRRQPEPELQEDGEELADIAEEHIQHAQTHAQADGEDHLQRQQRYNAR